MAAANNYWDAARGLWTDGATQNYMKPADAGGDGIWYSADGKQRYVNGVWSPNPGAYNVNTGGSAAGQQGAGNTGSSTNLQLNLGQPLQIAQIEQAGSEALAKINNEFQARQNALTQTFTAAQNEAQRKLAADLQAGQIDSNQYLAAKELAQRENEFARTLALQTLQADRDFQLKGADEARQERMLRANLAANPQDTVAYEMYKRGGASPEAWGMAQQFAQGGTATPAAGAATAPAGSGQFTPLSGEQYPADNPAYSDQTLQDLVAGFYDSGGQGSPGGPEALYNPRLSGTGAFGAQIQGPQAISRAKGQRMTDDEMGVLTSFLKAGVDVGGGKRVSLDPAEYFKQVENSWIPTLSGAKTGGMTEYR